MAASTLAQKNALSGYNDAREHLFACLEELQHAIRGGRAERITHCQQWVSEAIEREAQAFARLKPYLNVQVNTDEA